MTRKTFIQFWTAERIRDYRQAVANGTMRLSEAVMSELDAPKSGATFWRKWARSQRWAEMAVGDLFPNLIAGDAGEIKKLLADAEHTIKDVKRAGGGK